jgi:hypothetical protein
MGSLNDLFGEFPGRPDHEDFAHLADVVLQQDGIAIEDPDLDYGVYLSQFIDPDSLRHMAEQRAKRALNRMGLNPALNAELLFTMAATYMDAFVAGFRFHEKYRTEK